MDKFAQFMQEKYPGMYANRNKSTAWHSSDQKEIYDFLTTRNVKRLYGADDIQYKFNSHGFRCDDFTEESEFPVVFLGCSMTEGVGLPLEQTWAYLTWQKIVKYTNKKIPFWSLAVEGTGPITQANLLYHFRKYITKPALVISFLAPPERLEFTYGPVKDITLNAPWSRATIPNCKPVVEDYSFQLGQLESAARIFDAIAETGTKFLFAGWSYLDDDYAIIRRAKNLHVCFPVNFNKLDTHGNIKNIIDYARDGWHTGPIYNESLSDEYWTHTIKPYLQELNNTPI